MKKNATKLEVMKVEAEEIPLEEKIENSLIKANVTNAVIKKLEERYSGMKLKSVDDKESYLQIKEAKKNVRAVGIIVEKTCKAGREDAIKTQRLWLDKEKELLGKIEKVQQPLELEIKKFEDEVKRKENEENERREKVFQERQAVLIKYGAKYNNGSFELNHISYEIENIKQADDDIWESIIMPKYYAEFEKVEAEKVRIEKEREAAALKLKQEQEELKRQREQMEKERQALIDEAAALKKMKDDAEEKQRRIDQENQERLIKERRERINKRYDQLFALGMKFNAQYEAYVFEDVNVDNKTEINLFDDEEWDALIDKITPIIEEKKLAIEKKQIAEAEAQKKLEQQRIAGKARFASLCEIGFTDESEVNLGCMSDDDWNTMWSAYKAKYDKDQHEKWLADIKLKKELEDQRKAEELAQAGDKAKWLDVLRQINELSIPEMKSPTYRKKVAIFKEKISEIEEL